MKTIDDHTTLGAILLVLLLTIAVGWWWFPKKWQACERLYDNKPAQSLCLLATK
jgi:MFS superfamily sulfate permease-like transporter